MISRVQEQTWFKKTIMDAIEEKFKISKRESSNFKYTGVDIIRLDDGTIEISQETYKNSLNVVEIDTKEDNDRPLNKEEFKKFRGLTGKVSWLSDKTIEDAIYIARCIYEIYKNERGEGQLPVEVVIDSQPLLDSINSTKQVESKLLRPLIKYMKQTLDSKMIHSIRWCDTKVCLADVLTKRGSNLTSTFMQVLKTNKMIDLNWTDKPSKSQERVLK